MKFLLCHVRVVHVNIDPKRAQTKVITRVVVWSRIIDGGGDRVDVVGYLISGWFGESLLRCTSLLLTWLSGSIFVGGISLLVSFLQHIGTDLVFQAPLWSLCSPHAGDD